MDFSIRDNKYEVDLPELGQLVATANNDSSWFSRIRNAVTPVKKVAQKIFDTIAPHGTPQRFLTKYIIAPICGVVGTVVGTVYVASRVGSAITGRQNDSNYNYLLNIAVVVESIVIPSAIVFGVYKVRSECKNSYRIWMKKEKEFVDLESQKPREELSICERFKQLPDVLAPYGSVRRFVLRSELTKVTSFIITSFAGIELAGYATSPIWHSFLGEQHFNTTVIKYVETHNDFYSGELFNTTHYTNPIHATPVPEYFLMGCATGVVVFLVAGACYLGVNSYNSWKKKEEAEVALLNVITESLQAKRE